MLGMVGWYGVVWGMQMVILNNVFLLFLQLGSSERRSRTNPDTEPEERNSSIAHVSNRGLLPRARVKVRPAGIVMEIAATEVFRYSTSVWPTPSPS